MLCPRSLPLRREPRGEGSCLARCVIAARRLLRLVGWSLYRVPTGIEGGRRQGRRPDTGAGPIRHDEASMDRLASRRNSSILKPSRRTPRRTPRLESRLHPPVSPSHSRMAMWALLCTQTCGKAQLIQPTFLTIRRERRGRGHELRSLLANLGCSPASAASTRRSSLAWSCWAVIVMHSQGSSRTVAPTFSRPGMRMAHSPKSGHIACQYRKARALFEVNGRP